MKGVEMVGFVGAVHRVLVYYCWWSVFYGLGPMIWFYPLNELDMSGYEAFALVWLITPLTTTLPSVRRAIQSPSGIVLMELTILLGLVSFQMGSTLGRLVMLSVGNCGAMLYLCLRLFCGGVEGRWGELGVLVCCHVLFVASRVLTTSLAPAWSSSTNNAILLTLLAGSIMANHLVCNSQRGNDESWKIVSPLGWVAEVLSGISFGGVLFVSHWLFGDLHVVCRWASSDLPNWAPSPFLGAPLVLLGLILGLYIPQLIPFSARLPAFSLWLAGTCAFGCCYYLCAWGAFLSGVVLAVYCSILWMWIGGGVVRDGMRAGVVVSCGMLMYLCGTFFQVWTVAFNFVPGGIYTREHSDYLIAFLSLIFLISFLRPRLPSSPSLKLPNICGFIILLSVLCVLIGMGQRWGVQPVAHKTLDPANRELTALIWTFHFGYDNRGWPSLERAAQVLEKTDADVIALLESDASKPYLGHNDLAMWLSERLGMFVDFGPSTKAHTWGNLLLSKYPIISSRHHLLPSPRGELAPAISATLNVSGNLVEIVSTHMGNDGDSLDRQLQAQYLSRITAASPNSLIFLGYVTSAPGSRDYLQLTNEGGLKDIDDTDKHRWCEYIMYKRLIRLAYGRISHGGLSDTELQLARFAIPTNLHSYRDNDVIQTDVSKLAASRSRLSADFGGFTNFHHSPLEHRYHMATPKFFL